MPAELAEETLARLRADLPKLKARLKAEFENSAEWKAAVEAVKKAAKDYEAARRTALSRVRAKPEYVKAASEHEKARQEFDALADRDADEKTAESLLRRVLTARAAKDKLESAGLKADPAVDAAKEALVKAQSDLAALRRRFEDNYRYDPAWVNQTRRIESIEWADARREQEQEATRQQQATLEYARQQEENRVLRQELMNMAVRQVFLEQQNLALSRQCLNQPVYIAPQLGVCLPHGRQNLRARPAVHRLRPSPGLQSNTLGVGTEPTRIDPSPPPAPPPLAP